MSGAIIWAGASRLNGEPIVVIVSGLEGRSRNTKTGHMPQVWILTPKHPLEAVRSGADAAICGGCSLRGSADKDRACYVTLAHGPRVIWDAWQRGVYPEMTPAAAALAIRAQGGRVRFGAYGDPAAVPVAVWRALARGNRPLGYTQHWRDRRIMRSWLMASCHTEADVHEAREQGWRTFRTREAGAPALHGEKVCPSSKEARAARAAAVPGAAPVTCSDCMGCGGTEGHGPAGWVINLH